MFENTITCPCCQKQLRVKSHEKIKMHKNKNDTRIGMLEISSLEIMSVEPEDQV